MGKIGTDPGNTQIHFAASKEQSSSAEGTAHFHEEDWTKRLCLATAEKTWKRYISDMQRLGRGGIWQNHWRWH